MDTQEWDQVFQFVSDPMDASAVPEKPISEKTSLLNASHPPSQVPTPPASNTGSPGEVNPEINAVVSVSTTFFPTANLNPLPPDLILLSSDAVFFYVHSHHILSASENGFRGLLPAKSPKGLHPALKAIGLSEDLGPVIPLPEPATILNIVLHSIYSLSCAHYSPSLDTLIDAVDTLALYGVPVTRHCASSTPLYALILAHAPIAPIDVYALAAHHDLYDLAVPASAHLLGFQLWNLSDAHAARMGPLYLKQLFFLHLGRIDALKRLLLPPPHPHAPTADCDFTEQKKLTRAWALASAYLAWDARPDLSTSSMEGALCPLGSTCRARCAEEPDGAYQALIVQWSVVKRTI
ncbi:uncharacterized protein B0H18DRAFT_1112489 [Fomitopsis serialis]|uniref:uncharacterized protein n=1 Tax=Fomitopsis serialis TaxID=139415 RepID=UPI002008DD79|nr:uncharacterized protein B0H18DRAFT_1112489 [Neoantrodia serialis]KAH9938316.1 hypothetical protein B0H18DRAFT_1112489 [Neoantrodia serialis]